jgi:ABC-type glycerol-3-phosphate transport system substrate-binding protein
MGKLKLNKRLSVLLSLIVALSALLVACGDNTATTAPTTAAATTAAATTAAATTAKATTAAATTAAATTAAATTAAATTAAATTAAGTTAAATTAATSGGTGVTVNVAGTNVTIKPGGGKTFEPKSPVTITIWDSQRGANQDALVKLADAFHAKHPNITIKWDNNNNTYTYGSILKAAQAAATAGGLPNMATGYENWIPGFVDSKTILGFNQFISGDYGLTQAQLEDINPTFLSRGIFPQYANEMYLFPFGNSAPAMYYNKDVLDKYGLQVPQTWDDFVKASQTIAKQSNGATVGLVFNPKTVSEFVAGMYSQGCKIYDYASKTFYFTDPACVKQLQMYYDGVKDGYFRASDPTATNGDQAIFEQQQAAFYISSTSSRSYIDDDIAKGVNGAKQFNWNAQVIPHAGDVKPVTTLYGGGVLAFKGKSQDEDLATWEVAKYLASTDFTAQWATQSGYAPATKSALDNPAYKEFLSKNPHNGIPVEIVKYATVTEPKIGPWQTIRDEFDNDVFALFQDQSGQVTPATTMKKIQDVAQSVVK